MVVPEQMQIPVDHEPATFVTQRGVGLTRLPSGGVDGDHHITQHHRGSLAHG